MEAMGISSLIDFCESILLIIVSLLLIIILRIVIPF